MACYGDHDSYEYDDGTGFDDDGDDGYTGVCCDDCGEDTGDCDGAGECPGAVARAEERERDYEGACESREARLHDAHGDYDDGRNVFADPSGRSALRAASRNNPRNLPCPSCGKPDRLTPADRACGYRCDECADRDEGGF